MFCPKCGAEYGEDLTKCPTCDAPLVDEPPSHGENGSLDLVSVYETGEPALIELVKSILESEGIDSYTKGEGIQDLFAAGRIGVGYNPVVGPVEIMVPKKDVEKAKEILSDLEEGEFEQPEDEDEADEDDEPERAGAEKSRFIPYIIGILIGAAVAGIVSWIYLYQREHLSRIEHYDVNLDSKVDSIYHYDNGAITEIEKDRNFDGKMDSWCFYKNELIDLCKEDDYFNGTITSKRYFKNGDLSRVEIYSDTDDNALIIGHYTNELLSEKYWHHESTGKIWKKATFSNGIMKEEYIDTDYDGLFDKKVIYNSSERPIDSFAGSFSTP